MDSHMDSPMNPSSISAPPNSNAVKMSTSVKRACDACHRRKVKCDGVNPCRNCSSAQLTCTYHAIPQKKGPKGSRAKVISELRETQRLTTLSSKANRLPCNPDLSPTPGLLTPELMRDCVDFYFNHMYPTLPILHRARIDQQIIFVEQNADAYCLLSSLCAFTMMQPGMGVPGDPLGLDSLPGSNLMTATMLLEETLRVRKKYDHTETPGLNTLCTSFFIFACYHAIDLHNKAWFNLREATTLALIMGMQKEESYLQFDVVESSRRRRLYWLLFVTERAYALQRQRPMSLSATISLPTQGDDASDCQAHQLQGFINLASLYRPFDESLISLWNKTRNDCSPSYITALQKQLSDAVPAYLRANEGSNADLQQSQQWLRTMVWQLSIQNNGEEDMPFQYPDLMTLTSQFSQQNMGSQGSSLIEKLFSTSCALTDYLQLLPANSDPFPLVMGPRDHLHQFMALLSIIRNGDTRFLPLLLTKVHDVLPTLANPMLQSVPEGLCNPAAEVDIFDGFGNAVMGIPVQPDYPRISIPSHNQGSFKMEDQIMTPYDKRVEDLSSPGASDSAQTSQHSQHSHHSHSPSYASPRTIPSSTPLDLDFQNMSDYSQDHTFPDPSYQHQEFKREYVDVDPLAGLRRAPPLRQNSGHAHSHNHGGSFGGHGQNTQGMQMGMQLQMPPRSVPEYVHCHTPGTGGGGGGGMEGVDMLMGRSEMFR